MTWETIAVPKAQVTWCVVHKWGLLQVSRGSRPHLCSQAVGNERINEILDRKGLKWISFTGCPAFGTLLEARKSRGSSEKSSCSFTWKQACGGDQASDQDDSWRNSRRVFDWEETPGHTQNTWEGLHVLSGPGLSRHPPGRAAESDNYIVLPAEPPPPRGWSDGFISYKLASNSQYCFSDISIQGVAHLPCLYENKLHLFFSRGLFN